MENCWLENKDAYLLYNPWTLYIVYNVGVTVNTRQYLSCSKDFSSLYFKRTDTGKKVGGGPT